MPIRTFTISDYNLLIDIWQEAGLPFKPQGRDSLESMTAEMKKGILHILFYELDGKTVGTVMLTHDGRKGWINRLAILPYYRKQGIGKALVEEAERYFDELGIGIIACLIEDYNKTSLEVFHRMGYIDFGGMHYLTKRAKPEI